MYSFTKDFNTKEQVCAVELNTIEWCVYVQWEDKPRFWGLVGGLPSAQRFDRMQWDPFLLYRFYILVPELSHLNWQVLQNIWDFICDNTGITDSQKLTEFFGRYDWVYSPQFMTQMYQDTQYPEQLMKAVLSYIQHYQVNQDGWIFTQAIANNQVPSGYQSQLLRHDSVMAPSVAVGLHDRILEVLQYYKHLMTNALRFAKVNLNMDYPQIKAFEMELLRLLEKEDVQAVTEGRMRLLVATALANFLYKHRPDDVFEEQQCLNVAADWFNTYDSLPNPATVRNQIRHMNASHEKAAVWQIFDYGPYTNPSHKPLLIQLDNRYERQRVS